MRCLGRERAAAVVVVLVVLLGSDVAFADPCAGGAAPHNLQQPEYEPSVRPVGDFMASFVQSFLHTVQPRPFPEDLVLEIVKGQGDANQEFINDVLRYEIGFLVCAAIGILYIVLMPIVGLFLACCRCCGNCGGKMHQKQASSSHCRRRTLYWATFVITVIILAGNICMFRSNEAFKVSVDKSTVELNKVINNISTFITAVPQQVQFVVNESYVTIQEVNNNLDGIGLQLGSSFQKKLEAKFTPALHSLVIMDQGVVNNSVLLNKLNTSLTRLESSSSTIQSDIAAVKKQINNTFSKSDCTYCASFERDLNALTVDTSIRTSSLDELQAAMNEIIKSDLKSKIKEIEEQFKNIPGSVANNTRELVQTSKTQLEEIKSQISKVTTELPVSGLNDVLNQLEMVQGSIGTYTPEVEKAEYIRKSWVMPWGGTTFFAVLQFVCFLWCVCLTLCCVVLWVVLCNILALALGPLGLKPNVEPTKRSSTSNCGGTFFMIGAGFSFLISWLFMLLVLILFLIGGNTYMLMCKTWKDGELFKLVDTPGVIPGTAWRETFGVNVTISSIYRDCGKNKPAWSTFHLNQKINLDDLLNVSKYTDEIKKYFENTNIDLAPVTFLTPEVKDQLQRFSSKANDIDFKAPVQRLNNISRVNLNSTADILDQLANTTSGQAQQELKNEAQTLRKIQVDIETVIFPQLATINSTIAELKTPVGGINTTVGEVLSSVGEAQDFFNKNASEIVVSESGKFFDCQMRYFTAFADWAKMTITKEMGRCGPVAGAVDSAEHIVCSNIVASLNAFWFSLGWCMIFLIPSIILSIKLAKYYRRMKYSDAFDDHIDLNYIPRAHMNLK